MVAGRICPFCKAILVMKNDETYHYDPIVMVEEILYHCPKCGHEEIVEQLKQSYETLK